MNQIDTRPQQVASVLAYRENSLPLVATVNQDDISSAIIAVELQNSSGKKLYDVTTFTVIDQIILVSFTKQQVKAMPAITHCVISINGVYTYGFKITPQTGFGIPSNNVVDLTINLKGDKGDSGDLTAEAQALKLLMDQDKAATASDRIQTGQDRTATHNDALATEQGRSQTVTLASQVAGDREAAAGSATLAGQEAGIAEDFADAAIAAKNLSVSAKDTAVAQAGIATTKAGEANTSKVAAGISEGNAKTSENNSLANKAAAQLSADAALIQSGVYTTEALGRAAVTDGQAFKVQGTGDVAAYEFRRTNSSTSVLIATYPSSDLVNKIKDESANTTALINGTRILDTGALPGIFMPEQQFIHPRGETELAGNAQISAGTIANICFYEQMTQAVVFNKVRAYVSMLSAGDVVVRTYKSSTLQTNPANMVLMAETTILSGKFNLALASSQLIDFGTSFSRVKTGEFLYIIFSTNAVSKLRATTWNVNTSGPARHPVMYSAEVASPWTAAFVASNGTTTCQSSFELSFINDTTNAKYAYDQVKGKLDKLTIDDITGKLGGAYIPKIQLSPSRGDSELLGSNAFADANYYAFGQYELLTEAVAFNRFDMAIRVTTPGAITLRIYSGKTAPVNGFVLGAQKLLYSQDFASGSFNAIAATVATFTLTQYVHVDAGDYVYIVFYSATGNILESRRFATQTGASPLRHAYLCLFTPTNDVSNPWTSTWNITSTGSGFYGATFKLYNYDSDPDVTSRLTAVETKANANTAALLSAITKNSDNSVDGLFLPEVTYLHPRGVAEMNGEASFLGSGFQGVGLAKQMTKAVVFNKVEVPYYSTRTLGIITVRVYKGTGFNDAPGSMTLLNSQDIPSADFNKVSNGNAFQTIRFDYPVAVAANEYIHIYAYSTDSASDIAIRRWNNDTTSPARERFKFKNTATPWDVAWNTASGVNWATAFRLSLISNSVENRLSAIEALNNPRLILPSKIYAVVGTELSLYFDAMVLGKDYGLSGSLDYNVMVTCTGTISGATANLGTTKARCWRITPVTAEVGTYNFTVTVTDRKRNLLVSKTVSLIIVNNFNPSTAKYYLQLGDSITADSGSRVAIADRMSTLTGGVAPISTGSLTSGGVTAAFAKHEGHGGWKWVDFSTDGLAATQAPGNPLWNTAAGMLDIVNYRTNIGMGTNKFSVVSSQVGVNDMRALNTVYMSDAQIQLSIDRAKTIFSAFLSDNSATKIIIQLPTTMRNTPTANNTQEPYIRNLWRLREMIIAQFDNFIYSPQVYVGSVGLSVDRYFGYQFTTPVAGSRYTEIETIFTDDVHMRSQGYQQMGDALFPQLIALLQ